MPLHSKLYPTRQSLAKTKECIPYPEVSNLIGDRPVETAQLSLQMRIPREKTRTDKFSLVAAGLLYSGVDFLSTPFTDECFSMQATTSTFCPGMDFGNSLHESKQQLTFVSVELRRIEQHQRHVCWPAKCFLRVEISPAITSGLEKCEVSVLGPGVQFLMAF